MTMYKRNRKQLAMRIFCALLLGTCLLGGHQPVSADVATLTTNFFNRNISVNTNSGSVVLSLSGTATEPWQTALGRGAKATGNHATAIGAEAEATEQTSTALGNEAKAQKKGAVAIGSGARAEEENATALGYNAVANGKNALALGYNARAHLENSVAIGYNSSVGAVNSVSFGSSGATRRLMYVSAGESNTDAANFGQLLKSASLNGSKLEFYTNAFKKSFDVDLSSLSGAGGAGGTAIGGGNVAYDATGNGTLTLKSGTGSTIASIAGFTDKYTTGVTLTGNKVTFTRNDGGTYSFDLPASAGGGGMSSLKADIATNKAGIAANQAAISGIKAQNGVVASTGTAKADEFVRGTAVYDYLHGDTIALGKGSTATGMNSIAIGFGNQVKGKGSGAFGDPTTITGSGSYSVGNNNTIGGDNTFVLGNNVNTTANNAVVLGNNSEGVDNAVSVGAKGNERQIKNVADGTADSDAVTVRQLNKVAGFDVNTIDADLKAANTRITRMDSKVNKVGAGAAALAALHPLDMDNKFDVAAAFGSYHDANAMALGVFYRPTDNVMFSAGGAMGNGENMVNVGVTFALDKGEGVRVSKAAMAKKINALTDENAAMKEKLAAQDTEIGALKAALARLEAKMK